MAVLAPPPPPPGTRGSRGGPGKGGGLQAEARRLEVCPRPGFAPRRLAARASRVAPPLHSGSGPRRAPPPHLEAFSASAPARRAGGRAGAGRGGRGRGGAGGRREAAPRSRARCLPLAASAETAPCQNGARRGAARSGGGASRGLALRCSRLPSPKNAARGPLGGRPGRAGDASAPWRLGVHPASRARRSPLPRLCASSCSASPFIIIIIFSNGVAARGAVLNSWKGPGCTEDALQSHERRR